MNWYNSLLKLAGMTLEEALSLTGQSAVPSADEIRSLKRRLSLKHHPDRGGSNEMMGKINAALEVLEEAGSEGFSRSRYRPAPRPERQRYREWRENDAQEGNGYQPEWQTDSRSSNNEVGRDWNNINRCKHDIWEKAKEAGPLEDWTFWAFDGSYFRGVFTAKCNADTLDFGAEVMEYRNSNGGNPYPTAAVLASKDGKYFVMLRVNGRIDSEGRTLASDSFNSNPGNDRQFIEELKQIIRGHSG